MGSFLAVTLLVSGLQDAESVLQARESLRESLKEELAKPPAERAGLPHRLVGRARGEADPVARAALLLEAIDRAAEGNDLHVASMAFTELRKIPGSWLPARARILELREKKERPSAAAEAWFELALESFEAGAYEIAVPASGRAEGAAKRGDAAFLLEAARDLRESAVRAQREFEAVRVHARTLREDSANPAANEAMGRFHCFVRGRWDLGLPCLARAADGALRGAAEADRVAGEAQIFKIRAADLWWDWAEKQAVKAAKDGGRGRAVHWYEQADDGILEAVDRSRIERRIRTYSESLPPGPPGNVALARLRAKVAGATRGEDLLDGMTEGYTGTTGHALSRLPSEWVVTLPRAYPLRQVRLLLWENDDRFYRYTLEASSDGRAFDLLVDRSRGQSRGWQVHTFPARWVRAVRIRGLHNSASGHFHAVEFEAYCRPR